MAEKKVTQLRFFGDTNSYLNTSDKDAIYHQIDDNQPNSLSSIDLSSGDAFLDYMPIVQLGIQALPGTKFNLNANLESIIIGTSGMYELDLSNTSAILTSLRFDQDSLDAINATPDGYLIIDIVYRTD